MASKKWNQWKSQNLSHDDFPELNTIKKFLHEKHDIPLDRIKIDHFIIINMYDGRVLGPYPDIATWHNLENSKIHRPDLTVLNRQGYIKFLIELDGSVHDSGSGARKTAKRNSHYKDAELDVIIINKADLKFLGISWRKFLNDEIRRTMSELHEIDNRDRNWRSHV